MLPAAPRDHRGAGRRARVRSDRDTLTVSPYQDAAAIRDAGNSAAADASLGYVDTDFTSRYREAVERSRELGMYRQRYCGCEPSRLEAEESRGRTRG